MKNAIIAIFNLIGSWNPGKGQYFSMFLDENILLQNFFSLFFIKQTLKNFYCFIKKV